MAYHDKNAILAIGGTHVRLCIENKIISIKGTIK